MSDIVVWSALCGTYIISGALNAFLLSLFIFIVPMMKMSDWRDELENALE